MRIVRTALLVAATLALVAPADLAAQGKKKGHDNQKQRAEARQHDRDHPSGRRAEREHPRARHADRARIEERVVLRDRDGRLVVRERGRAIVFHDDDVDRRYDARRRGQGPAFCRSGAGHPVHGRSWCLDKGFGLGDRDDVFFLDDERVAYWDGDEVVVVRDRRLDRERTVWERVLDTVLFWTD